MCEIYLFSCVLAYLNIYCISAIARICQYYQNMRTFGILFREGSQPLEFPVVALTIRHRRIGVRKVSHFNDLAVRIKTQTAYDTFTLHVNLTFGNNFQST